MKDRAGLPLKGYEKNKTWVRVLALLHIIILGLFTIFIIFSTMFSIHNIKKTSDSFHQQSVSNDAERRSDIETMQTALKSYHAQKGYYPLNLTELSLSDATCSDPQNKSGTCKFPDYIYTPYSSVGTNTGCNNTFAKCQAYTLESNRMESDPINPTYKVTGE